MRFSIQESAMASVCVRAWIFAEYGRITVSLTNPDVDLDSAVAATDRQSSQHIHYVSPSVSRIGTCFQTRRLPN